MVETRVERRLAAILAADVVGYSRFMREDEAGTHARLKSLRTELLDPKTADYKGRVVKTTGDGFLIEFQSAVDAVRHAIDIQQALARRNDDLPEDLSLELRIGINVGDVIVEGDDLYGDAVNVAARLEGLADPGGICISGSAHEQVRHKLNLTFEDLGEKTVKNISEPVRVFQVVIDQKADKQIIGERGTAKRHWPSITVAVAVVAIVIVAAGGLWWFKPWAPAIEPASVERMAFPLPDMPSIAVLPFANMSDDPNQDYFADGISEDLITDLSRVSGLFVISRNSTFTYKGQTVKIREVAEELGVRYVLEGSARRIGDQVRINAQLIDATTGGHLWAERYDGSLTDVFALQDSVTQQIVEALAVELAPHEAQRVGRGTDNTAAHDAYLLGLSLYYRRTPQDNAKAATYFKEAIELDPNYAAAYTALAKVYLGEATIIRDVANYSRHLGIFWRDGHAEAWRYLRKGMTEPNEDFHVLLSQLALSKHRHGSAIVEAEMALDLNPNSADALDAAAEAMIFSGRSKEGIELAQRSMRHNPTLLARPLYLMGLAEFALGYPDKAIDLIERARELAPESRYFSGALAAAYGEIGQIEQAEAALANFAAVHDRSGFDTRRPQIGWAMISFPFVDQNVLERLLAGFRSAGAKDFGYLPMHPGNKLSGAEIKALIFGNEISGQDFWHGESWKQTRTEDGTVEHSGFPIHVGIALGADRRRAASGFGRINDDQLCETWPGFSEEFEQCFVFFRIPEGRMRIRGDYVMVTEQGPQLFRVVE